MTRFCPIQESTLHAGQVLYVPPYFWHSVRNCTSKTLAVATRWNLPSLAPLAIDRFLIHICAIDDVSEMLGNTDPSCSVGTGAAMRRTATATPTPSPSVQNVHEYLDRLSEVTERTSHQDLQSQVEEIWKYWRRSNARSQCHQRTSLGAALTS